MAKDCGYFRRLFKPYMAGEMDASRRKELATHLAECKECSAAFGVEWRARLEERTPSTGPRKRPGSWVRGFSSRRRLTLVLLVITGIAVLVLARSNFTSRKDGVSAPSIEALVKETIELLRSNQRLNEALIFTALKNRKPLPKSFQLQAMRTLARARKALISGKKEDILDCFHPLFKFQEYSKAGTVDRTVMLGSIIDSPSNYSDMLDAGSFEWWGADDETISLFSFGAGTGAPSFILLMKHEDKWKVYWVAR